MVDASEYSQEIRRMYVLVHFRRTTLTSSLDEENVFAYVVSENIFRSDLIENFVDCYSVDEFHVTDFYSVDENYR
jgi:hypothetical protein